MNETDAEFLVSGPFSVERPGYDGQAFAWYVGPKRLEIRFTETVMEIGAEGLSTRGERALASLGRSEVIEFLAWHTPPDWVEFSTDNVPWIEGGSVDGDD